MHCLLLWDYNFNKYIPLIISWGVAFFFNPLQKRNRKAKCKYLFLVILELEYLISPTYSSCTQHNKVNLMVLFLLELWTCSVEGWLLETSQNTGPDEAASFWILGLILEDISEFTDKGKSPSDGNCWTGFGELDCFFNHRVKKNNWILNYITYIAYIFLLEGILHLCYTLSGAFIWRHWKQT